MGMQVVQMTDPFMLAYMTGPELLQVKHKTQLIIKQGLGMQVLEQVEHHFRSSQANIEL